MALPPRELAIAGLTGALSLVDPADLAPRQLMAYRLTCATLSGAFAYDALRNDDEFADKPAVQVAVAVGGAGAVFVTMGFWERWDNRLHRWLAARGVSRPRLVIAAGATVTSLLGPLLDSKAGLPRALPSGRGGHASQPGRRPHGDR